MLRWIQEHRELVDLLVIGSIVTFLASLVLVPFVVARLPADYFAHAEAPESVWKDAHPIARVVLLVARNVFGAVLVVLGLGLVFLPGQGLITAVLGLGLMSFPGKRQLELALVRRPPVLRALNWLRKKAKRAPLRVWQPHDR